MRNKTVVLIDKIMSVAQDGDGHIWRDTIMLMIQNELDAAHSEGYDSGYDDGYADGAGISD